VGPCEVGADRQRGGGGGEGVYNSGARVITVFCWMVVSSLKVNSDAGELPKKEHITIETRTKLENKIFKVVG
jgi:hypothetical protein